MSNALMELLEKQKQKFTASRRSKTEKIPVGHSRWRILPGWDANDSTFFHDFGQHFIKDANKEVKAVYMCVDKTYNKPCSLCSAIQHAITNSSDDGMVKLLESARSSKRVLLNAVQVDGKEPTTPVVLEVPPTVFEAVVNNLYEWGPDSLSLDKGRELMIEKTGSGMLTKYSVQVSSRSTPLPASIMEKVTNLKEYVNQESEENANRALTSLAAISGLLPPAGGRPAVRPALASPASLRDITHESVMDITEVDEADEALRQLEVEVVAASKPAEVKAPVAAAPVVTSTGDPEIDKLLAELN